MVIGLVSDNVGAGGLHKEQAKAILYLRVEVREVHLRCSHEEQELHLMLVCFLVKWRVHILHVQNGLVVVIGVLVFEAGVLIGELAFVGGIGCGELWYIDYVCGKQQKLAKRVG